MAFFLCAGLMLCGCVEAINCFSPDGVVFGVAAAVVVLPMANRLTLALSLCLALSVRLIGVEFDVDEALVLARDPPFGDPPPPPDDTVRTTTLLLRPPPIDVSSVVVVVVRRFGVVRRNRILKNTRDITAKRIKNGMTFSYLLFMRSNSVLFAVESNPAVFVCA